MLQICIHRAHSFAKRSVLPFSGLVHLPIPQMGAKFAECYVCWAGGWPKQTQHSCENRERHTAILTHLTGRKKVSHKINIHI